MVEINRYRGDGLPPDGNPANVYPYRADVSLAKAVNMAIVLERPLLVKGPPGCGKTRLAYSIAHELDLTLYRWYVKSTSRARDGLYMIDVVRRLQDAQLGNPKAQKLINYVQYGPLGTAIRSGAEAVVLIDEIDKADIDFPNDLLRELEEKKFTIEELAEADIDEPTTFEAKHSPIIIITSNDEKELPDAFLRRCLFYYIEFPTPAQLVKIVQVNLAELNIDEQLVAQAITRLNELRELADFRKKPATSELLDWVRILHHWGVKVEELDETDALSELPYWQVLFKYQQDQQLVLRTANTLEARGG